MPEKTKMSRPKLPFGEGEQGLHVRAIQRSAVLLNCEYPLGAAHHVVLSGRFKETTAGWVRELQQEFGQPQTGKVDQQFIVALKKEAGIDYWRLLEFNYRREEKRKKKKGADAPYSLTLVPPSA